MDDELYTERDLTAPPERVWEAISDPERLGRWFGADIDLELVPGNEGTIVFHDRDEPALVLVEEVDDGRRLVLRWATSLEQPSEVSIDLMPIETGTRIAIRERQLPNGTVSPIATMSSQWSMSSQSSQTLACSST